ncbi:unnamed protein product [Cylindrotheca closterium]|uniref:DDE Tnp4 domain-containing protein n=1 Tax=Cylindrotheca closterium TaxID=2856 RepID=A0AAD2FGY4_9STRA|nr:unnamed protein product [Cylindrotheca closterium]
MLFPSLSEELCGELARDLFGNPNANKNKTNAALDKEICESLIGTPYRVAAELWNMINPLENDQIPQEAHPNHLLWTLCFLKNYCSEPVMVRLVGFVDPKTFRKWVWIFIPAIAAQRVDVIKWIRRFEEWDHQTVCVITVDGVDCAIQEPWPFDEAIFSKKLNGPGYKYEIGICIATGVIVWVNGPFKAGKNDKTIFEEDGLMNALCDNECVEVDMGYQGLDELKNPKMYQTQKAGKQKSKARARHENVNGELKKFAVLDQVFRHDPLTKHKCCFEAVAVICQMRHDQGGRRNTVEYGATYY